MHHSIDPGSAGWVILLTSLPVGFAVLLYWTSQHSRLAGKFRAFEGLSPTSIGTVGVLFGLFSAFLASDIWQRVHDFELGFEREASAIDHLQNIAEAMGDNGEPILLVLKDYVRVSIYGAPAMIDGRQFAHAGDTLDRVFPAISDAVQGQYSHLAARSIMLTDVKEILDARATRNYIAHSHSDPHKWVAVMLLGLLTQLTIALTYVERSKVQAAALTIFTLAFVVSIAIFATHERGMADPTFVPLQSKVELSENSGATLRRDSGVGLASCGVNAELESSK